MEGEKNIQVKGMVCDRCIKVVTRALTDLGLEVIDANLGSITVIGIPNRVSIKMVEKVLINHGFELLKNDDTSLANEVKQVINGLIDLNRVYEMRPKYSKFLSEKLGVPYDNIKSHFFHAEGITLEKYIINQRLEKAKELLVYTNLTLTEIAFILGFSSLQHLSKQFKEMTGLSPSHFKRIKDKKEQVIARSRNKQ